MPTRETEIIDCPPQAGWAGIAAALAAARPGQTLRILPGRYRGATALSVPRGVTLEGRPGSLLEWLGPDGAEPAAGHGSAVLVDAADDVTLIGLRIRSRVADPGEAAAPERTDDALIHCRDARRLRIDGCDCAGAGSLAHGIHLAHCDGARVGGCRVEGCRFGVALSSSTDAVIRDLACLGNRWSGITLCRHPTTPERASSAELIANRCHDNAQAGISLESSQARANANSCWANGYCGIALQRDPKSPDAASNAELIANRCHDNAQAGIGLFSSQARAEANACWGNGMHGIALQRDSDSPDAASDAELIANRCHDNAQAGICLFSSQARAEANACWGNGIDGIALQRDPNSPDAPSDAELIANRCHDNAYSGIFLSSSQARAEANACWGNGISASRCNATRTAPTPPATPS